MADGDWENDDFEPKVFKKPLIKSDRWEGEDEDDDVKDNWDDDDEEGEKEKGKSESAVAVQPKKKRNLAAIIAEKEEKKRKELEEKKRLAAEREEEVSAEEALAEKLKQQKLQEEADLELAKETFGVLDPSPGIDTMNPTTKEEFDEFRKALANKMMKCEGSGHYLMFLEDLCRDLCLNLQPDDIKKITSTLNAIAHEKIKSQKASKAKKKSKKATLNLGKDDFTIIDYGDEYEDCI